MIQLRGQMTQVGGHTIAHVPKKQYLCIGFEKACFQTTPRRPLVEKSLNSKL